MRGGLDVRASRAQGGSERGRGAESESESESRGCAPGLGPGSEAARSE